MPKVSVAYREARRDEIATAALRCLERKGVRDTSMADIAEESGLSIGAIYSHFASKSELARFIAGRYLMPRIEAFDLEAAHGAVIPPRAIVSTLLAAFVDAGLPTAVVLQFWSEAMTDGEMHDEMLRTASRLREGLSAAVRPWAEASGADDPERAVQETTRTMMALVQGWIANTAVFGPRDPDEYLSSAAAVLAG